MKIERTARWCIAAMIALWAAAASAESTTWVAIYDHSDGTAKGPKNLVAILTEEAGFRCEILKPVEIRDGRLSSFDVLIMPGGSGSKQSAMLEEEGRREIKDFVTKGGGYVGICAGSYLASSHYEWSLHLLNAQVFDREHWARGTGQVQLDVSDAGQVLLDVDGPAVEVYYGQGPLLVPDSKPDLPKFEVLASYASEIAKKGAPTGVMVGTTAIARAPYGEGRVICFSPHCEASGGPHQMIVTGVRWAAGHEDLVVPMQEKVQEAAVSSQ
jgi:putative intracellular protease/amidase